MANFFFLSFDGFTSIKHAKISVKFDNLGKGKARISFRLITTLSEISDHSELYLLIKNVENPVTLEKTNSKYNKFLNTEQFRQVAGVFGLNQMRSLTHYSVFTIGEFPENPNIESKTAIHPKEITCERVDYKNIPEQLQGKITRRDILLRIEIDNVKKILEEASSIIKESYVWIFQFRIVLGRFISEESLRCWRSSSKSWSVDFDIHKRRNYENLVESLNGLGVQRYPESLELWFTIPHSHQFVASSPVYEKAFRLKSEDITYKTEKQQVGEFETQEGDYAVKIVNRSGSFVEFSIICTSPFLPEETPGELRKKIEEFWSKESSFVTWDRMMNPLILLLALLTLVFGIVSIFVTGMTETLELRLTLWTIIVAAVFFGLSVWGISVSFSLLSDHLFLEKTKHRADLVLESDPRTRYLIMSVIIVVAVLAFSLFYLLGKVYLF